MRTDGKSQWLQHLIEEKQISSIFYLYLDYLKTMLDRELAKVECSIKIQDAFRKK